MSKHRITHLDLSDIQSVGYCCHWIIPKYGWFNELNWTVHWMYFWWKKCCNIHVFKNNPVCAALVSPWKKLVSIHSYVWYEDRFTHSGMGKNTWIKSDAITKIGWICWRINLCYHRLKFLWHFILELVNFLFFLCFVAKIQIMLLFSLNTIQCTSCTVYITIPVYIIILLSQLVSDVHP